MQLSLATLVLAATAAAKNILLTNDDGFAATNIRATYRALTKAGHDVFLVAPVMQRSGWGGRFIIPDLPTLVLQVDFGYRKIGDPLWGSEPDDNHIWYFNATPAACVAFGLDHVIPNYFGNVLIDLVVAGPNEGTNLGQALYTLLGTMGATYNSLYRGVPAVAFSGSNSNNSFYKDSLNDDPENPSNIYADAVVDFVAHLFESQGENPLVLPLSTGISVNLPPVGSQLKTGCNKPGWELTRLTGSDAYSWVLHFNQTSGVFVLDTIHYNALGNGITGDLTLPGENTILTLTGCKSTVLVFSIDYDATTEQTNAVKGLLGNLFSE